jgi:hypothetical protein
VLDLDELEERFFETVKEIIDGKRMVLGSQIFMNLKRSKEQVGSSFAGMDFWGWSINNPRFFRFAISKLLVNLAC